MPPHVLGDGRLTHRDPQLLQAPRGSEAHPRADSRWTARGSGARTSGGTAGRPVRCRLFQVQNRRKPRRCHAMTVSGLTMCRAERQPRHDRESHAHSIRSTRVKRRRGRRDRFTTASWCRSAMISRCSEARDRTRNRSEWSSETTTDTTPGGYRRTAVTSIDATRTELSVATGEREQGSSPLSRSVGGGREAETV